MAFNKSKYHAEQHEKIKIIKTGSKHERTMGFRVALQKKLPGPRRVRKFSFQSENRHLPDPPVSAAHTTW